MRASVKMVLAGLVAIVALLVFNQQRQEARKAAPVEETAASLPSQIHPRKAAPAPAPEVSVEAAATTALLPASDATSDVEDTISRLFEYAAYDEPAYLESILAELTHPNPEIRAAALEATAQFGSRDAIPRLQEVAAATNDAQEKAALEETIEFLELPSWSEIRGQISEAPQPQPTRQKQGLLRRKSGS